jgi:plasmid segregation protein ParM
MCKDLHILQFFLKKYVDKFQNYGSRCQFWSKLPKIFGEVLLMLIAVDHGNYSIKTPNFSFVAGLAEHTVRPITDDYLEYDGRFWTLTETRLHYMRDKTQDNRYFVLTLFAIIKELEKASALSPSLTVELAAGLPPEHYSVLKDRFASYLACDHPIQFTYKERHYSLSIPKVLVYPQAYAAVVANSNLAVKEMRLFLIDIGGYTTDVLMIRNGKPDLQYCRSLECGTITMYNEIIRKINARYDLRIDDEHISAVLTGKNTILSSEVKSEICAATSSHANNILNQLRELQIDLRSNPAVFLGGGSLLLKPYLEKSNLVKNASFILSTNANAVGFKLLATTALSRGR